MPVLNASFQYTAYAYVVNIEDRMKTEMSDVVVVEGESCAAICLSSESPFRLRAIGYRTFAWAPGRRRRRRQTEAVLVIPLAVHVSLGIRLNPPAGSIILP